jgi:CRISPR/Cas system endoribonuclease Cas6 (RAMP superfamily)
MSQSRFEQKLNTYLNKRFKSLYGKNLSKSMFGIEEVKKMLKAAYMDGYDDCNRMYESMSQGERK